MSIEDLVQNRTYDEIEIGESVSLTHKLTKRELEGFAAVSGDCNPIHLDETYASLRGLKAPTAHGMWTAALISNLLGNRLPGAGTVYVAQDLNFLNPVFLGDQVTVTVTVTEKIDQDHRVRLDCRCVNQEGLTVLTGLAEVRAPTTKEALPAIMRPSFTVQAHDIFEHFARQASELPPVACAVAYPCDESSLTGVVEATEEGLIEPILIGPEAKIRALAAEHGLILGAMPIIDEPSPRHAAVRAVAEVAAGRAGMLMKGSLHTDELLAAVVSKEGGMRTARRISHVFVMAVPTYPEPLFITDAAVNIAPDLETKVDIVQNAIDLARGLGITAPKVAVLAAVETVSPKMPVTIEAAALAKMADRGQITGGLVDGPFAFDNAISAVAAKVKGITSPVAGHANILLVPNLEAGNMLAKNLSFLAEADAAGIVLGAKVPIILTSRADTVRTRLASAAIAKLYAHALSGRGHGGAA